MAPCILGHRSPNESLTTSNNVPLLLHPSPISTILHHDRPNKHHGQFGRIIPLFSTRTLCRTHSVLHLAWSKYNTITIPTHPRIHRIPLLHRQSPIRNIPKHLPDSGPNFPKIRPPNPHIPRPIQRHPRTPIRIPDMDHRSHARRCIPQRQCIHG